MGNAPAWASIAALSAILVIGGQQIQFVKGFSYSITDGGSCLALPPQANAQWDQRLSRCTVRGALVLSQHEVLTTGQGVTFAVAGKASVTSSGTIRNAEGATFLVVGKIANEQGAAIINGGMILSKGRFSNAGSVTNLGNMTFTSQGALVNSGTIANFIHASFKNSGKGANTGVLANYVNATLVNSGRLNNNATIIDVGRIENRGTLFNLENSKLVIFKGGTVRNTGNIMLYCNSYVNGTISARSAIDRCDDPPAVAMSAWSPFGGTGMDGSVGTLFTFFANATDDVRLARIEWDFDGDGLADESEQVSGKSAIMVNATHAYGKEGTYRPEVRAVDSAGDASAWSRLTVSGIPADLIVEPANAIPVASNSTLTISQNAAVHVTLNATDADGDALEYYVLSQPAHGGLTGTAPDMVYMSDDGYSGTDSFTFVASDGKDDSEAATVSIRIIGDARNAEKNAAEEQTTNNNPIASSQTVNGVEDAPVSFRLAGTDPDNDWIEYSVLSEPEHGTLSGRAPDLTYTPDAEYNGQDSLAFRASDSFGGSSVAAVTIIVASVNDPPAAYDDSASTTQGTPVTVDVLANDEDVETQNLTVTSTSMPRNGTAAINGDMTVTYTPNTGFSGGDYFTYSISDGDGGTASATVSVEVQALPSEPAPVPTPPAPAPPATGELYCGREISTFSSVIRGTEGSDILVGTNGDDLILGLGGDDTIRGRGGNDCIIGGAGDDSIWGGDGNDVIYGNEGNDKIVGDAGNDLIFGGDGDDNIWGSDGDDVLHGENGDDKVIGDDGNDMIYGDDGNDRLWGGAGDDSLYGGNGDDRLVGDSGNDVLYGEAGDDKLYDDMGDDTLDGGDGRDLGFDIVGHNTIVNCERH
jgi:Ca2+-binding RTX toxin-like protein